MRAISKSILMKRNNIPLTTSSKGGRSDDVPLHWGSTKYENKHYLSLRVKRSNPPLLNKCNGLLLPTSRYRDDEGVYSHGNNKLELLNSLFLYRLPRSIKVFLLLSILTTISVLILSGCSTGAYPVDVFPEGHYQQSYRSQEPPRLQPPIDSVPITGKEITYNFSEAGNLMNPVSASTEIMTKANQLYQVNCAICHGASGRGDGPMTSYFQQAGAPPPLDYMSPRVKSRKDGELFWIITNGLGTMPRFGPLLTAEERWALVHFIRSVSGSSQ